MLPVENTLRGRGVVKNSPEVYELDDVRPSGEFLGVVGGSASSGGSVTTSESLSLN